MSRTTSARLSATASSKALLQASDDFLWPGHFTELHGVSPVL